MTNSNEDLDDIIKKGQEAQHKKIMQMVNKKHQERISNGETFEDEPTALAFTNFKTKTNKMRKPSNAFIGASWIGLLASGIAYCVGLWNSTMPMTEKGFYFTLLMYGIFSAVSLQKAVRDRLDKIKVTNIYYGIAWFSTALPILLMIVGLSNSTMTPSERGFYGMSYLFCLFAGIAVQKNIRDTSDVEE